MTFVKNITLQMRDILNHNLVKNGAILSLNGLIRSLITSLVRFGASRFFVGQDLCQLGLVVREVLIYYCNKERKSLIWHCKWKSSTFFSLENILLDSLVTFSFVQKEISLNMLSTTVCLFFSLLLVTWQING